MDLIHDYLTNGTALAALLSIIFLYSLFLYNRSSNGSKSKEAPIVTGAWPILGHLPLLKASKAPHRTLGDLADKYGPLFTIKLGSKIALVLSNSEMAKECFTKYDAAISTRPKLVATEHLAYNGAMLILSPYGPYWRQVRKVALSEILANRRIEKLQEICVLEVQTSIKALFYVWKSNNNESNYVLIELRQWFIELNFNIVLPMLVGKRYFGAMNELDEKEAQKCIKAVEEILRLMGQFIVGDAIPCLERFDFGGHVKAMKKTSKELDMILDEWLKERRCNRTLNKKVDRDQDFMDVLLSLFDGTTIEGFDADTTIKATMLSLIAGGIDTSAITLTWAICLLLKNPHTLEKAKAELDFQVGRDKCVTKSDINKLVYLQAIIKETLRLYPVGPLSAPREFTENCNVGGYDVKKGTRLILNLWKIQTDHNVWSDPLEFKPERFLNTHKDVDVRGRHFELLPFGSGRRICPGISFGLEMMHLILANFLHSFEILYSSGEPIDMTEVFGLTVSKATPLEILVKPCLSINCYETM